MIVTAEINKQNIYNEADLALSIMNVGRSVIRKLLSKSPAEAVLI